MSKVTLSTMMLIFLFSCAPREQNRQAVELEIRSVMDRQIASWNRGDIEGFMSYYWNSGDFTFQSGDRRLEGWEQLLAMYRQNYAGEKRGVLDFTDVEINVLSPDAAYVLGRWRIKTVDTTKAGLFTLIFRNLDGEWRIVHDHSS
jgi:uncharacterized protein (TIGR02246 family)